MDRDAIISTIDSYFCRAKQENTIVIVKGEVGIGKSSTINQLLNSHLSKDIIPVHINGGQFDTDSYSTISHAVYRYIQKVGTKREIRNKLMKRASTLIPNYGQFVSDIIGTDFQHEALDELIKRAGINTEPNFFNPLDFIRFFEKQTRIFPVVFYCQNIQWFDKKSLDFIFHLLPLLYDRKWFCILSYATNAESQTHSHGEIITFINQLKLQSRDKTCVINLERWTRGELLTLCKKILGNDICLRESQLDDIFVYTEGLPLYVKIILDELIRCEYIILQDNIWISKRPWTSQQVRDILKESVKEKVKRVYTEIPEGRDMLEIGSVVQDEFTDTFMQEILTLPNHPAKILSEIEQRFQIIQYVLDERIWRFKNFIVQDYIYRTLGEKVKDIHLLAAKYLENKMSGRNYLKIAKNFKLGGEINKAIEYYLKEIESLLDRGCYRTCEIILGDFEDNYRFSILFNLDQKTTYEFLRARFLFHNAQYSSAKEAFLEILKKTDDEELKMGCYRWLAKIFLKLDTQFDFYEALQCLNTLKIYHEEKNNYSILGDVLLDFIVAYAHMNNREKSRELYQEAEVYFNKVNDKIGMLRLQRRSIIFMDNKLSACLLLQTAKTWESLNVAREQIMCLNNAATQYIYSHEYDKAEQILTEAIENSETLDNFGRIYLYNNMGIVQCLKNNISAAKEYFFNAKKTATRVVDQIVIDINLGLYYFHSNESTDVLTILEGLYQQSLRTGEDAYIVPAALNYAIILLRKGMPEKCLYLLETIQESIKIYTTHEFALWYETLFELYGTYNPQKQQQLFQLYSTKVKMYQQRYPKYPHFVFCTLEFWSDS